MNQKIMNELFAKRAILINTVRDMVAAGVKDEDRVNYNKAMADLNFIADQIENENRIAAIEGVTFEAIAEPQNISPKEGFMNMIRFGDASHAEKVMNAVGTGSSSAGYLVPEELHNEIVRILYEEAAMMQLAQVIRTSTLTDIPVDATGVTAYWIDEAGAFTDSSPTVTRIQLGANKVGAMVKVSEELLADSSFNVESYITDLAGKAIARSAENEFINGTVSGRPTGIIGSATQALTSSVTNSFNYNNLMTLFTSVKTPYAKNGSFLVNRGTLGTIMTLQDGASNYIFQPAYKNGETDMLLNCPLKTSEYMPALTTTAKGVLFGDFGYYKIGLRGAMSVQRLNELYAGNGQVGFRFFTRMDGKLALAEAVKSMACL